MMQKSWKWLKPWHIGTHMRVLIENYLMNTNMTGFRWFSKYLRRCALDESSISIGRAKNHWVVCIRSFQDDPNPKRSVPPCSTQDGVWATDSHPPFLLQHNSISFHLMSHGEKPINLHPLSGEANYWLRTSITRVRTPLTLSYPEFQVLLAQDFYYTSKDSLNPFIPWVPGAIGSGFLLHE